MFNNVFKTYDENKGKLVWRLWFILMVELLGTFAMVFEIIAPNALQLGNADVVGKGFSDFYNAVFGTFLMKAVWVTAFIWILIQICGKVSVNLNPAVTLTEVAEGKFGWNRASLMILVQVIGALAAAEMAYQIGHFMEVKAVTLDAVHPVFQVPAWMDGGNFNETSHIWNSKDGSVNTFWEVIGVVIIPVVLEMALTFLLLVSVFYGNFDNPEKGGVTQKRALMIFALVTVAVYIGIYTENIALNPARLLGPAIIGQAHSSADSAVEGNLGFSVLYLMGELLAVLTFILIANAKHEKEGVTKETFRKEIRILASEVMVTKARYEWVLAGNKTLESMDKDELIKAAKFCEIDHSIEETKDDLEYDILEWIIFGLESNKKPPLVNGRKPIVRKEKTVEKEPVKVKKEVSNVTKEESIKRETEREKLKAKVAKQTEGKKISSADLKKMKLTDLYGIGVKREEYFKANGITDMIKLSNKNPDTLTKKFVEGLPALKSWTYEMKLDAIKANIAEADFMVKELTK